MKAQRSHGTHGRPDELLQMDGVNGGGEYIELPGWIVTARASGRFAPVPDDLLSAGQDVSEGETVGFVVTEGRRVAVRSPSAGTFMRALPLRGERLKAFSPVAWIVSAEA